MKKFSNYPSGARSFAINSLAISLTCYPLTCYQTHLLSTQLISHSFAIKPHLLSGLNCYRHTCYQANLLSILSHFCYQSSFAVKFSPCSQSLLETVFSKNPQKMEKFLKIWNFSVSGKLCLGMESARFVASSKGTNSRLKENG